MLIKVFGSPTVVRDGREVTGAGTQRRRLALLAVLAVGAPPGRAGVSRERLLELLWPGAGEERGRAALSQALYAIRRDLGRDDAITGTSALRLNADCVRCDLWDFLAAIADGADREAAELRTAPLLDGFDLPEASAFEFWMEEQRQEIDRSWRLAVDRAARAAEQTGDLTAMVRWRRALANADPLSGRTAVALARSLDAAGEREAALRHLKVHMALVRQELEGEPHAEVVQLAEELQRAGRPAPSPAPVALLAPAAPALALPPAPPPTAIAAAPSRGGGAWRWGLAVTAVILTLALGAWLANRRPSLPVAVAVTPVDTVPVVAVGEIVGDSLGRAVASMLATNLARASGVEVIASARMLELATGGGGDAAARAMTAAREAGATDLVDGSLLRDGSTWRLELRRATVATGRVSQAIRMEGREIFALVDGASAELLGALQREAPSTSVAEVSTRSIEAWRLYEAGLRATTEGRRDAAVALIQGALRADSTFAIAALTLATLLPDGSREKTAMIERAVRMSPQATPRDAMLIRASWLGATNDPRAGAVIDSLARRYPSDLEIQLTVAGPLLFEQADFARAAQALQRVWMVDSARLGRCAHGRCYAREAIIHLSTVFQFADTLRAAESWARRYIGLQPQDWLGWERLAAVLEREGRYAELGSVVDSAVQRGDAESRQYMVLAAIRRGDTLAFASALASLQLSPARRALDEPRWRAFLYRNAGLWDEALGAARRFARAAAAAGRDRGDDRAPATVEAAILLDRGDARAAAAILDSLARAPHPGQTPSQRAGFVTWFRTLAATARFEAGDTTGLAALADSLSIVGQASAAARDRALHHHVRGLAYLAAGKRDEAIAELRQGIVYPATGFTRANWHLARALAAAGRPDEARRWLLAALRAPQDAGDYYIGTATLRRALAEVGGR